MLFLSIWIVERENRKIVFASLLILEYLVFVVTRRGTVFVAVTAFSSALEIQEAFGIAALATMG